MAQEFVTEAGHTAQEEFKTVLVKAPLRERKQGTYTFVASIKQSLKNSLEDSFQNIPCYSEKTKNQPKNATQADADVHRSGKTCVHTTDKLNQDGTADGAGNRPENQTKCSEARFHLIREIPRHF